MPSDYLDFISIIKWNNIIVYNSVNFLNLCYRCRARGGGGDPQVETQIMSHTGANVDDRQPVIITTTVITTGDQEGNNRKLLTIYVCVELKMSKLNSNDIAAVAETHRLSQHSLHVLIRQCKQFIKQEFLNCDF